MNNWVFAYQYKFHISKHSIGFDLGCSYTCVAICINGKITMIPEESRITYGYLAKSQTNKNSNNDIKKCIDI